jgi:CheY-like chemotaxis protein
MAILIIEDEFLVAADIRSCLERGGLRDLEHVSTESDALSAIAARDWDTAVVDANLNGRGIDRIAAALNQKNVPFVIVTGYGRQGLPQAVADVEVINKPFAPRRLVDAVRQLCARERR